MGLIAEWLATEVVENPADADYVFADDYTTPINLQDEGGELKVQTVIRSFDVEKLNTLANS
jgi:hypothetical protein